MAVPATIAVERPKNRDHGDYATNVALQLAKPAGRPPREVAELIADRLREADGIAGSTSPARASSTSRSPPALAGRAGPRHRRRRGGVRPQRRPGRQRINLEFVSANPTGPVHLGDTRWAAVGDALAPGPRGRRRRGHPRVLPQRRRRADRPVRRRRCAAAAHGQPGPGGRLRRRLHRRHRQGDRRRRCPASSTCRRTSSWPIFRERGLRAHARRDQAGRSTSSVRTSTSGSPRSALHDSGAVDSGLATLREQGHVYEQDGAIWLRTTDFGDDKDRVLVKADGEWTYFAADCAYYLDKRSSGLRRLHLPARRRPPRLRQPAAGGRGLRRRRPGRQHRGPDRPAGQPAQGRRAGPDVQAGRHHHHPRRPRRRGRRRRGALHPGPLPGRLADDPRHRPDRPGRPTTTRSSTCSTRTPGSPRCCATPPSSASTGATTFDPALLSTEQESDLVLRAGRVPAGRGHGRRAARAAPGRALPRGAGRHLSPVLRRLPGAADGRRAGQRPAPGPALARARRPVSCWPTASDLLGVSAPERM